MQKDCGPVMVAVDGSEQSFEALESAARLANRFDCDKVIVVHVVSPTILPESGEFGSGMESQVLQVLEKQGESILAEAEERIGGSGCCIDTRLLHGDPAMEIVDCADAEEVSLLIVGSRGLTGMSRFLLGSVSERVVRNVSCSVMVVR